jgi:hypothetical protein
LRAFRTLIRTSSIRSGSALTKVMWLRLMAQ